MMGLRTEQERFWEGNFGDEYIERNKSEDILAKKTAYFAEIFRNKYVLNSILEFGSNIGMNELALQRLFPAIQMETVEINKSAAEICSRIPNTIVHRQSFLDYETDKQFDLTMCNGVLIHTNPDFLDLMYEKLFCYSKRYILIGEYYNPTPVEVEYRGHSERLFKRDFAGELLDKYVGRVRLIDYGFVYHRDNCFDQDDINWFLLEKVLS